MVSTCRPLFQNKSTNCQRQICSSQKREGEQLGVSEGKIWRKVILSYTVPIRVACVTDDDDGRADLVRKLPYIYTYVYLRLNHFQDPEQTFIILFLGAISNRWRTLQESEYDYSPPPLSYHPLHAYTPLRLFFKSKNYQCNNKLITSTCVKQQEVWRLHLAIQLKKNHV